MAVPVATLESIFYEITLSLFSKNQKRDWMLGPAVILRRTISSQSSFNTIEVQEQRARARLKIFMHVGAWAII